MASEDDLKVALWGLQMVNRLSRAASMLELVVRGQMLMCDWRYDGLIPSDSAIHTHQVGRFHVAASLATWIVLFNCYFHGDSHVQSDILRLEKTLFSFPTVDVDIGALIKLLASRVASFYPHFDGSIKSRIALKHEA